MGVSRPCRVAVLVACAVNAAACGGGNAGLAEVGKTRLEIEPFQIYLGKASGEAWQGLSARVASGLLDQYLDRHVVIEAARQRDLLTHAEPSQFGPSEMRWLLEELCGPSAEPSTADVEREVERRLGENLSAQAHVRQILVDSLEQAESARQRLAAGDDFVTVSREMSRAPNAMDGGELGIFSEGGLPEEVDAVVFSLAPDEISNPVQGHSGYHIFQVLEMIPAGPPERSDVEFTVLRELTERRAREHTRGCIERLASEVGVDVNPTNIWFAYDGKYGKDRVDA